MSRLFLLILCAGPAIAADWPQFRGPTADGHYTGPKPPTEWGIDKNVAWKTAIPGKGWSSPIVWKGKVYLTTAVAPAKEPASLRAVCIDAATGTVDWNKEVLTASAETAERMHGKNSLASPTPATDGQRLYVHFGHMGTAALSLDGKVLWTRTDIYQQPRHGSGGSPVLVDGRLVFSCDGMDKQVVVALDPGTGKTAWEVPRKNGADRPFSFNTPTVVEQGGKKLVLSVGSNVVSALEAKGGKEVWRFKFNGYSNIPKPVVGHGQVFFATGYDNSQLKSVKLGGTGDVTQTHAGWTAAKGAPHTPSPLLVGNELYTVSDAGLLTCFDAKTGKQVWQERVKGAYSASPIYADGKIYLTNETGHGTVVEAGRTFNVVGESDLNEKTYASFAAVDGALYVRTETQLYRFGGGR